MQHVIELNCPGCGARVSSKDTECEYCHKPIVISSLATLNNFSTLELNKYASSYQKVLTDEPNDKLISKSIALCYLKLNLYDKATKYFSTAIEENFEDSEVYFYAAIGLLKGKKAFAAIREDINKILEYLDAAIMIEPKGIYYYFESYIKYDFFARKSYSTSPNYKELLELAHESGVTESDKDTLFELLKVERPEVL